MLRYGLEVLSHRLKGYGTRYFSYLLAPYEQTEPYARFAAGFREAAGHPPDSPFAVLAYDAVMVIARALAARDRANRPDRTALAALWAAMRDLGPFYGASGPLA